LGGGHSTKKTAPPPRPLNNESSAMPMPALLLLLATLLPLASFAVLLVMGRRLGDPLAGWLATAFIGGSFALSLAGTVAWFNGGQLAGLFWGLADKPIAMAMRWLPITVGSPGHGGFLDVDLYIDSLTVAMFNLITLISLLVHFFSIRYLATDGGFARFFTRLALFSFSMLGLAIGGSLLQIFIFWSLGGACAYMLIAFWHDRPAAGAAALRTFLIQRIGDVAFFIGLAIIVLHFGTLSLPRLVRLTTLAAAPIPPMALNLAVIFIVGAVIAKAAQFPLHLWLMDAMEAPAPAAGLLAVILVGSGVYLITRLYPILTPQARLVVAIFGLLTLSIGALLSLAQGDIKRLLAAVVMAQLGFMLMALGIGSWVGALFHLIMFAFFQTLLFLAAASVIRAVGHSTDLTQMGGLLGKVPVTATTFMIGVLTVAGMPTLCGAASEQMIFSSAAGFAATAARHAHWPALARAFYILPVSAMLVIAYSMMRCWMLVFWGKPRNPRRYNHAHETTVLWFPVLVSAVLCIVGGTRLLEARTLVEQSAIETQNFATHPTDASPIGAAAPAWAQESGETARQPHWVAWAWAIGIAIALLIHLRGYAVPRLFLFLPPVRLVRAWLLNRMYFDVLYVSAVAVISRAAGRFATAANRMLIELPSDRLAGTVRVVARAVAAVDEHWLP
jgi:NADH-quinone oxidoreductase subunit L